MAQVTSLSVIGTPGRVQTFLAKTASVLTDFPCIISATVETVRGMAATLDVLKAVASTVDLTKGISAQIECEH